MKLAKYLPRFQKAYRSFAELEARETWTREEIESLQLKRINEVWLHAHDHVPYYRRLSAEHRLPRRFESLGQFQADFPILDKDHIRKDPLEFLSERAAPGKWHRTSGSTGTPLRAYRAYDAHQEANCAQYRHYHAWGIDYFDPMVVLWNMQDMLGPGVKARWKRGLKLAEDTLRNRMRLSTHDLGPENLRRYLAKIAAYRPAAIYTFSRAAYLLAREAKAVGFRCPSLRLVNVTSEPANEHLVRTIADAFGVPVTVQYGCVELGYAASTFPDGTMRVREDIVMMETLPRGDGRYDILKTGLNNPSFPLLRYAVADISDHPLELPERGFAILKDITGRSEDLLFDPRGRCVHPATVATLFENSYLNEVRRYQVHQRSDGSLVALVELTSGQVRLDTRLMAARISRLAGGYPAQVEVVPHVPQTAAGKHRHVISEMQAQRALEEPLQAAEQAAAAAAR